MTPKDRGLLEELAMMALAAGGGAADELTFGAAAKDKIFGYDNPIADDLKELKEDSPLSYGAGQVGSYFVPGGGVLGLTKGAGKLATKAGAKMPKMLADLSKYLTLAPNASKKMQALSGTLRGAGGGALESGGQAAIRNLLDTGGGDVNESIKEGLIGGGAFGAASPLLRSAAQRLYRDPRIFNPTGNRKARLISDELLDEGVWGGEDSLRKYASGQKDKYNALLQPKRDAIAPEKADIDEIFRFYEEAKEPFTRTRQLRRQLDEEQANLFKKYANDPTWEGVQKYQKGINEFLSPLSPAQKTTAIAGAGDASVSAANQAAGLMKGSIQKAEKNALVKRFGQTAKSDLRAANKAYSKGSELERSLDRARGVQNPLDANIGPYGAGVIIGGGDQGKVAAMLGTVGAMTGLKSLAGRTGSGVALNKMARSPERTASKGAAMYRMLDRPEAGAKELEQENPYLKYIKEPEMDEEENPYMRFIK